MRLILPTALGLSLLSFASLAQQDFGDVYKKAISLYQKGQYAGALPLFQQVLKLAEAQYGVDSPLLSLDLNNLGETYRQLGRFREAESLYQRAIELDERGGETGEGLAISLNNLGRLYSEQKRLDQAEPLYKRSLALLEQTFGPRHPRVAESLNNLAMLYRMQGLPEQARPLQERAVLVAEEALGADHPTTKLLRRNLETVLARPAAPAATAAKGGKVQAAAPNPGTRPAAAAAAGGTGPFAVHLASVRNPAQAATEWRRLSGRFPALAGLALRSPEPVEVPGKGIYYRVAGGAFAARAQAQAICDQIRAQGAYCSVVGR